MPAVFVHGVPDTHRVWQPLLAQLRHDDAVALSLPGFGTPILEEFAATKEDYVGWLTDSLAALPQPVDIVSHDWGTLIAVRALSLRPDLARSWVGGGVPLTSDYAWHTTARLWQTPGAGEKAMERLDATLTAHMLARAGLPEEMAAAAARAIDPTMKDCILRLYRSGASVFREWEADLVRVRAPGLILWGEDDVYAEARFADRAGTATGARVVRLASCGHWWQCQAPKRSAREIASFWDECSSTAEAS